VAAPSPRLDEPKNRRQPEYRDEVHHFISILRGDKANMFIVEAVDSTSCDGGENNCIVPGSHRSDSTLTEIVLTLLDKRSA
jgi:hypothetical protein